MRVQTELTIVQPVMLPSGSVTKLYSYPCQQLLCVKGLRHIVRRAPQEHIHLAVHPGLCAEHYNRHTIKPWEQLLP